MKRLNKPYLLEFIACLTDKGVEFIICGGMAVVYHGIERMTMDLDIAINMAPDNMKKFLAAVKDLGLTPRVPVPPESLLEKKMVDFFIREKNAIVFTFWDTDSPYRQIDIFLTKDKSYDVLLEHTIDAAVGDHIVKIISIEKLLEMKLAIQPPRDKDKMDIAALKKIIEQEKRGRG
jgi:predicted nucleotidyltransferase